MVVYKSKTRLADSAKLRILKSIFENHTDQDSVLYYSDLALEIANTMNSDIWQFRIHLEKGHAYSLKGDLDLALEAYLSSQGYAQKMNYSRGSALAFSAMGDIYSTLGNKKNSLAYYNMAIDGFRLIGDSLSLATTLLNIR